MPQQKTDTTPPGSNQSSPPTGDAPRPEVLPINETKIDASEREILSNLELVGGLMEERTLFQVWKSSLVIPHSRTSLAWLGLTFALLVAYVWQRRPPEAELAGAVRSWAEAGFGFSASVLGFLIAGFTIFASLGNIRFLLFLATKQHDSTPRFSYLKDGFFRLLRVFAEYWAFAVLCVLLKVFAYENGPATHLLLTANASWPSAKYIITSFGFALMGALFVYVLFALNVFIFNVHHLVMTYIRYGFHYGDSHPPSEKT